MKNGRSHHFALNSLTLSITFSVVAMFLVGYLAATAYLVFRDDLLGAAHLRQARLLHEYEDRIATLRTNLDRVTSRQLLDQQVIEAKIADLLERQEALRNRSGRVGELVDTARRNGILEAPATVAPDSATDTMTTGSIAPEAPIKLADMGLTLRGTRDGGTAAQPAIMPAIPDVADLHATETLFANMADRMNAIDSGQIATLDEIRQAAGDRTTRIAGVMRQLGVKVKGMEEDAVGGPFIPADIDNSFGARLEATDASLKMLDRLSSGLRKIPLANPAQGHQVTSRYGQRVDPFLNRMAMHAGIDFRVSIGTPVRATAAGTVIDAGWNGGYGVMVEIDHGNGITTRYGHLSRTKVKTGDVVEVGTVIGLSGSTGRSTGPHLHYEIRRSGNAIDPIRYIRAGRELARQG